MKPKPVETVVSRNAKNVTASSRVEELATVGLPSKAVLFFPRSSSSCRFLSILRLIILRTGSDDDAQFLLTLSVIGGVVQTKAARSCPRDGCT
jgi:hypothetical protein